MYIKMKQLQLDSFHKCFSHHTAIVKNEPFSGVDLQLETFREIYSEWDTLFFSKERLRGLTFLFIGDLSLKTFLRCS